MWHKSRIVILALCLVLSIGAKAYDGDEQMRISLLTCAPGEELYARFGHTALRVSDPANKIDYVFNYGIFDFNTDHFYWKFVKGETWYELGASPYWWFMREYRETVRPVYEQVLNLNAEQREAVWQALVENYQPENRQYLYNFVFDNCATRPFLLIERVLGEPIVSDYTGHTGETYRHFIWRYTPKGSWADFGINLLFGPKADQAMSSAQRLFLPEELMYYMSQARYGETPMVADEFIAPFTIERVPWYKTWYFGLGLYFILLCLISLYDRKRQRWSWGIEVAVGIPYLLLLIIVTFLTFFSCHPLVGFGWRLLIIPLTHLCARLIYILR